MKKILTTITLILNLTHSEPMVTEDMIYQSVANAIKGIPKSISKISNHIYRTEIKKEKTFWWYFNKNQPIKTRLKKRKIDYYTLIKQGLYPEKPYDQSRENEMKKYAILVALAKENEIDISDIIGKTEEKKKIKKKLKIKITDREIKKELQKAIKEVE